MHNKMTATIRIYTVRVVTSLRFIFNKRGKKRMLRVAYAFVHNCCYSDCPNVKSGYKETSLTKHFAH